jgi:hypothetical protein
MEYNRYNEKMLGVIDGVYYGQLDRLDELNHRISDRNKPDFNLAPNFDPRPVQTKYVLFPAYDYRKPSNVPIQHEIRHQSEVNFYPGNSRGPPSTFFVNVDVETDLRNQNIALQHGASRGVYVPSSNSDLYKVSVVSRPTNQPHPELFRRQQYYTHVPESLEQSKIGIDRFYNHTRTQLRNNV